MGKGGGVEKGGRRWIRGIRWDGQKERSRDHEVLSFVVIAAMDGGREPERERERGFREDTGVLCFVNFYVI